MSYINKNEIFVDDLDEYYKGKEYDGELIGLYEPDSFDLEVVIQNYANTKYQFIAYFEHKIPKIPKYNNINIEIDFNNFYTNSSVFAVYQEEEYYEFGVKIFAEYYFKPCFR